jgi:polyhydroxyalkanoate synthesis regulator phasin
MSAGLSRAELEAMDRDQLIETIVELSATVEDLQAELKEVREHAAKDRAAIRRGVNETEKDLRSQQRQDVDTLHHERSKLARRVSALENELDVEPSAAVQIAEAGSEETAEYSRLSLLLRHGPEAVSDRPTQRMYRARELLQNWDRWGTTRNDAHNDGPERRLAAKGHDLKTRLEDARGESLSWKQVYRAMQLIDEWSGKTIALRDGTADEGKHVLVFEEGSA